MEFFKFHDKYGSIIELYKFFNKVTGVPIVDLATRAMLG